MKDWNGWRIALIAGLMVFFAVLFAGNLFNKPTSDDFYYLYKIKTQPGFTVLNIFNPVVQARLLPPFYRPSSVIPFLVFGVDQFTAVRATQYLARLAALALFFFLARRLTPAAPVAPWIALLLFAVNPGQVEPVIWPSNTCDSLLVPAVLAALLFFAQATAQEKPWRRHLLFALALGAFAAALTSKEPAVIVPLLVLLLIPRARWRPALAWVALFCVVLAGYLAMRAWAQQHLGGSETFKARYEYGPLLVYLGRLPALLHKALGVLIVGPFCQSPALFQAASCLAWLVLAEYVFHRLGRERRLAALVPLLLCLLPPLITRGLGSGRYAYFPAAGLAIILGDTAARLARRRWTVVPAVALLAAIVTLQAHLTLYQASLFRQAGEITGKLTRFLDRAEGDEILLASVPSLLVGSTWRHWQPQGYVLEPIYPEWIYAARHGRRATVTPLAITWGTADQLTSCSFDANRLTLRHPQRIGVMPPSILEDLKRPDLAPYVELEKKEPRQLVFRWKRPGLPIYVERPGGYDALWMPEQQNREGK